MKRLWVITLAVTGVMGVGCGGGASDALSSGGGHRVKREAPPPRERGCAVQVFSDAPPNSENVGTVTASCAEQDSRDVCLRELEDQVCLLGGDALWQVEGPKPEDTQNGPRQRMRGRAAHSK